MSSADNPCNRHGDWLGEWWSSDGPDAMDADGVLCIRFNRDGRALLTVPYKGQAIVVWIPPEKVSSLSDMAAYAVSWCAEHRFGDDGICPDCGRSMADANKHHCPRHCRDCGKPITFEQSQDWAGYCPDCGYAYAVGQLP